MRIAAALLLAIGFTLPGLADARCVCRCVNGDVKALCDSALEVPPICAPQVCPITPPSVQPIEPPRVPPIGTKECRQEQVYNSYTRRYEWKTVCR